MVEADFDTGNSCLKCNFNSLMYGLFSPTSEAMLFRPQALTDNFHSNGSKDRRTGTQLGIHNSNKKAKS